MKSGETLTLKGNKINCFPRYLSLSDLLIYIADTFEAENSLNVAVTEVVCQH